MCIKKLCGCLCSQSFKRHSFIWIKIIPGKRVTLTAKSTLVCVHMRKKMTLFPETTTSARACSDLYPARHTCEQAH